MNPSAMQYAQPPMKRMKMEEDSNTVANKAFSAMLEGLAGDGADYKAQTEKDEEVQSLLQDMAQSRVVSDENLWDGQWRDLFYEFEGWL